MSELRDMYVVNHSRAGTAAIELEAFEDKKLGKLDARLSSGNFVFNLGAQGPIDESSKEVEFADLDGLKNGIKGTLGIHYWYIDKEKLRKFGESNRNRCLDLKIMQKKLIEKLKNCHDEHEDQIQGYQNEEELYKIVCKEHYDALNKITIACSETDSYRTKDDKNKLLDLSSHIVGLNISYGNDDFKWIDDTTLESKKENEQAYAVELIYSHINNRFQRLNLGFRYEEFYRSQTKQTICVPISQVTGAQSCREGSFGAPKKIESNIAFVEYKYYFGRSDRFAMAPRISRDFENNVTGIDVPIYLYQTGKPLGLQGGVRFGWISDTGEDKDDTIVGLFISKPFSITK